MSGHADGQKWTKEPWTFVSDCGEVVPPIVSCYVDQPPRMVARMVVASTIPSRHPSEFEARANGDRIVFCVNAMAGIPDPAAFVERAKRIEDAARDLIGCWQDDISPLTNPIERLITALETP